MRSPPTSLDMRTYSLNSARYLTRCCASGTDQEKEASAASRTTTGMHFSGAFWSVTERPGDSDLECHGVYRAPLRPGSATSGHERLQQGTTSGHAEP